MPSSEIMKDFEEGHLHSGRSGKIVKSKRQAKAIQISYACAEGKMPKKYCKGRGKLDILPSLKEGDSYEGS